MSNELSTAQEDAELIQLLEAELEDLTRKLAESEAQVNAVLHFHSVENILEYKASTMLMLYEKP